MRVHAVQLDIAWEDRRRNHAKLRDLLGSASLQPGDMIVLPEMFDVGFSMNVEKTAQSGDLPSDRFVAELASELGCCTVAGVISAATDGRPGNEAVVVDSAGTEIARYRKRHAFSFAAEEKRYAAGDRNVAFTWAGMRCAPFICYDLRFPEVYRESALGGVQFLITLANWPRQRSEHWVRLLQARAIENQAYALGVNRCGKDPNVAYDGRSALFGPQGECIFECDAGEQVASAELDPAAVDTWRAEFPALKDAL